MKTAYFCDRCGRQFDAKKECLEHEARHAMVDRLERENPPLHKIGEHIPILGRMRKICSMSYDIDRGWLYNLGYDEYLHPVDVAENEVVGCIADEDGMNGMVKIMDRQLLKSGKKQMYAVVDKDDDGELSFHVRHDEKLPFALKLAKTRLATQKREAPNERTEHILYFPDVPDVIVLVEFCTDAHDTGNASFFCYETDGKKFPYPMKIALCGAGMYNDIMNGKTKLPDGLDVSGAIDLMDFIS